MQAFGGVRASSGSRCSPQVVVRERARPAVQAKLDVGAPGDRFEREADRVADEVMRSGNPAAIEARRAPAIQRACTACAREDEKIRGQPQGTALEAPAGLAERVGPLRGGGVPLGASTRAFFESRFARDFSAVRVHADPTAAELSGAVRARAFTVGNDIFFHHGQYSPATDGGRRLIAHELAHVVQQEHSGAHLQRQPADDTTDAPVIKDVRAEVATIDRRWSWIKSIAKRSETAAPWLAAGDTVVGLIHDHVDGAIAAFRGQDSVLLPQFTSVLETDMVAFDYVAWHAFAYQNIDRTRSWVGGLVASFDADKRDFTGRQQAEEAARALDKLAQSVPADSPHELALLTTDVVYKLTGSGGSTVSITLTSAADKRRRTAMKAETADITKLDQSVEIAVYNLNGFVKTARSEGYAQAVDALEQYYQVTQFLDAGKPSGEQSESDTTPKQEEQKQTEPSTAPAPAPVHPEPDKRTCATDKPGMLRCDSLPADYAYRSASAALEAMKRQTGDKNLSLHSPRPATSGPCVGDGTHYNVRSGNKRAGSIGCCPCCIDTGVAPASVTRCRIIW